MNRHTIMRCDKKKKPNAPHTRPSRPAQRSKPVQTYKEAVHSGQEYGRFPS